MKQGGEAVLQIARQYLLEKHAKDGDASEIVSTLAGKINIRFKAENSKPGSVFKTIDWKQIMTHFGSFQKLICSRSDLFAVTKGEGKQNDTCCSLISTAPGEIGGSGLPAHHKMRLESARLAGEPGLGWNGMEGHNHAMQPMQQSAQHWNHVQQMQNMHVQHQRQQQLLMMQQQQQHLHPHLQYHPSSTPNTSTPSNKSGQQHSMSPLNTFLIPDHGTNALPADVQPLHPSPSHLATPYYSQQDMPSVPFATHNAANAGGPGGGGRGRGVPTLNSPAPPSTTGGDLTHTVSAMEFIPGGAVFAHQPPQPPMQVPQLVPRVLQFAGIPAGELENAVSNVRQEGREPFGRAVKETIEAMSEEPHKCELQSKGLTTLFLMAGSDHERAAIVSAGGLPVIIRALHEKNLFAQASATLYNLSIARETRKALMEHDVITPLVKPIIGCKPSSREALMPLMTLQMLTLSSSASYDMATQQLQTSGVLQRITQLTEQLPGACVWCLCVCVL